MNIGVGAWGFRALVVGVVPWMWVVFSLRGSHPAVKNFTAGGVKKLSIRP